LKTTFLALITAFALYSQVSNAQTTAIVNKNHPVSTVLLVDAVQLYTGKLTSWDNGENVIVVILPREHPVSREFILDQLKMSPYQFYESVNVSINIRKNNSILKVCCENEVIKVVSQKAGSIGYTSEYIYVNNSGEVKKIKIK